MPQLRTTTLWQCFSKFNAILPKRNRKLTTCIIEIFQQPHLSKQIQTDENNFISIVNPILS